MIYFFTHHHHSYTIKSFLDGWGRSVRPHVTLRNYDELRFSHRLAPGGYIFADLDRIDSANRKFVEAVGEQLAARDWPMLNRPSQIVYRVDLLKKARDAGLSRVAAYRVDQIPADLRYPAFVRIDDDHTGRLGPPCNDGAALEESIKTFSDISRENLFVFEFADARGSDGVYRKYAVQNTNGTLTPRHIMFSHDWIVKYTKLVDPHLLEEEEKFITQMPDWIAEQVRQIFTLAGTTYGRLDFGVIDGRVQPWEINLNPMLAKSPDQVDLGRLRTQGESTGKIREAFHQFAEMSEKVSNEAPLELNIPTDLRAGVGVNGAEGRLLFLGKALGRAEKLPVINQLVRTCRRARWLASR
ncbi:MAG TPA: hypothetical protein VL282_03495 [Tepidisphaeraceae bacterium]|nr:hypothetical protein [Tepidisphaeraceae bacterium]